MAIHEKVLSHAVSVLQGNFIDYAYFARLTLESSGKVHIYFPPVPPPNFLTFSPGLTTVYLPESRFTEIYHILQTEPAVFFTALSLFGLTIANVTTEADLTNVLAANMGPGGNDVVKLMSAFRKTEEVETGS